MAQNTPADWQGDYVSFHRNNRTRDFTVMGNIHLRDKNLSLKAVGLLSKMLSFNDSWQFSTRGLAAICKEGPDAILSTLKELEENGYLVRHRSRDDKGRLVTTEFDIYESPQAGLPHGGTPHRENPDVDNPCGDKSAQISTDQVITQERNTLSKNNQSINLDGMDRMDERNRYEEIIRQNLVYDILCQDPKFDNDRFQEMIDIMLDAVCSTAPTIRINGEDMPQQVVKSRFLKLNKTERVESTRRRYGEFQNVFLSGEECTQLETAYPGKAAEYIERLSRYMASNDRHYANHYATIKKWLDEDSKGRSAKNYTYDDNEGECL